MWMLQTAEGVEPPFAFRILPGNIKTIGRATGANFIVEAALVSRVHCRLTAGASELEVVDLDSTNGTFVNGTRVPRAILKNGDRLGVGRVELVVSCSPESWRSCVHVDRTDREASTNPRRSLGEGGHRRR